LEDLPKRRVLYALNAVDHTGLHGALEPTLDSLVLCGGAGQWDPLGDKMVISVSANRIPVITCSMRIALADSKNGRCADRNLVSKLGHGILVPVGRYWIG